MRALRAFGRFWYDFIIGDDWKIAVAVVSGLALLALLLVTKSLGDRSLTVLGAVVLLAAFSVSLAIDVRPRS